MNYFFAVLAFTATVATLLTSGTVTEAQSLGGTIPSCKDLVQSLAIKQIRVFVEAEGSQGIANELCYDIDENTMRFV